jgi:hypothetical protein
MGAMGVSEEDRKARVSGPKRPCGSIAKERRIMLASRRQQHHDYPTRIIILIWKSRR